MTPRSELDFDHVIQVPPAQAKAFAKKVGTPVVGCRAELGPDNQPIPAWSAFVEWRGDDAVILLVTYLHVADFRTDDGHAILAGQRILVEWPGE